MITNFIWFAVPAPNNVFRVESFTPIIIGIRECFSSGIYCNNLYIEKKRHLFYMQ